MCQTVSASQPECVPLCMSMGLDRCDCEEAEKECEVCCWNSTLQRCVSLETPLADGSECEGGVCINVSATLSKQAGREGGREERGDQSHRPL